jgi:tight junction protein 1
VTTDFLFLELMESVQLNMCLNQVNDMDMKGVTREEAVLFLLSLQDQIDLIVQYRKDEYEQIVASQRGDSFHIK